ncbi:MAG: histidine kinase, partial [Flavobacteriales bacterium]|nr:histidine kinase [Flavobacteriales bacterium]
ESEALVIDTVNNRILAAFGDLYLLDANTLKQLDKRKGNVKSIAISEGKISIVDGPDLKTLEYNGKKFGSELDVMYMDPAVYQNAIDDQGKQWLLTATGVLIDGLELTVPKSTFKPSLMATTFGGRVYLSDRKGSIIVAQNGAFQRWLTIPKPVLQNASVRSMAASETELFVLLSNALLIHDLKSENWERIGQSEGLPSTDLKDVAIDKERVWIATFNGLYSIPLQRNERKIEPKVQLRMFRVNGQSTPLKFPLKFSHDENDIEVVLRGISTKSRGHIQFAYKLHGLMDDYELNDNGSVLHFRSLAPGNYELDVYALDVNGTPSDAHLKLKFSIKSPWYQTWPFIILSGLLLIAVVSTIFLLRIRYINQRNTRQLEHSQLTEELRASQLTALRAQMNPHFMFNVLNSIQGLFTLGKTEKANEVLSRFSDLMRSILDVSDQNTITLDKEMELIGLYLELEAVRFGNDFQYQIELSDTIDPKKVQVPSLLIQPYVENAVKHGLLHRRGKKKLSVSIELDEAANALLIRIEDNGVGREKAAELRSKKHKSFANEASSSRLDLLNVENKLKIGVEIIDLQNDTGEATGTVVFLRIPFR